MFLLPSGVYLFQQHLVHASAASQLLRRKNLRAFSPSIMRDVTRSSCFPILALLCLESCLG